MLDGDYRHWASAERLNFEDLKRPILIHKSVMYIQLKTVSISESRSNPTTNNTALADSRRTVTGENL